MALLWIDGFEGYGTSGLPDPVGAIGQRYHTVREDLMTIVSGRSVGYALRLTNSTTDTWIKTPALTTNDTLIVSCAFKVTRVDVTIKFMHMYSEGTRGMAFAIASGGEMAVYRQDTLLDTTSGLGLLADTWYFAEFKVKCNNSTGTYELKIDTVTVLSASGVDTQPGGNAYHDRVFFGRAGWAGSYPLTIDDFSICDSSGAKNNNFLGVTKVGIISPDGDDTANWSTVQPGPNHYEAVNETPADEDITYVEDDTVNITDLYDYAEVQSFIGDIYGLQINTDCRETDAETFSLITPVESNSSQYDDGAQSIGTTDYRTIRRVLEEDPDTGNYWIKAGVEAAKFGIKVG